MCVAFTGTLLGRLVLATLPTITPRLRHQRPRVMYRTWHAWVVSTPGARSYRPRYDLYQLVIDFMKILYVKLFMSSPSK